jgi:chromosome partitioning protein
MRSSGADDGRPHCRRIVLLSSPKGGTGKSSLARNLLVCGARAGLDVLGIDFDRQSTLHKWFLRRERLREGIPEAPRVEVCAAALANWRSVLEESVGHDLVVIDTPPSIEDHYHAAVGLAGAAHLVLVPSGQTQDDIDSVSPWMQALGKAGVTAAFVLNKANRRTRSYETARARLLKVGQLAPVEIPSLEDIHLTAGKGLSVIDVKGAKASESFDALWSYVAREAGVDLEVVA